MLVLSTNAFPEVNNISVHGEVFTIGADNYWIKQEAASKADFVSLMTQSDLIVVGTVIARNRDKGNNLFKFSGLGEIDYIAEIKIVEVIAYIGDQEGGNRKLSLDETIYIFQYPAVDGRVNDPFLLKGGKFLLWLKNIEVLETDIEKYGLSQNACYKVNSGRSGAIFLSKLEELSVYPYFKKLNREKFNPYSYQENLIKDCFGDISSAELVRITKDFSGALLENESNEKLNNFANSNNSIYSNTAKKILDYGKHKRFKNIDFKD